MDTVQLGNSSAGPRIGDILGLLSGILSAAWATSACAERSFLGSVFLETGVDERQYAGRLVLAPTLDPTHPSFPPQVHALRESGAAGVIIKHAATGIPDLSPELAEWVLILDPEADWADTAQSIRALTSGDSGLVASGIRQGDLFALANTLASLAGGAVSLVDTAGRIVGYSTHADQPIDALRRSTTLSLRENHHPRADEHFQQLAATARSLFFPSEGKLFGRVAVPVRSAGELLGTVWIVQVDPAGAAETQRFLDSVEPLVSHHMLRARETALTDERRSTDLLRALFEDARSRRSAAAQLGLNPGMAHTVVCFRITDTSGVSPVLGAQQLVHQAATTAKGQFGWSHCAILDGVIVALLGSSDMSLLRLFADRITQTSSGGAVSGIGRVAATQTQIPQSYRDAVSICQLLATTAGTSDRAPAGASAPAPTPPLTPGLALAEESGAPSPSRPRRTVAAFDEVRAELGLARLGEMLQDSELLDGDDAERILAHDRDQQSQLAPTLLSVLTHQGSVREAALELHIHQNTVRYRLETIRTELGIDLDHAPTRLWLWLRLSCATDG